MFIMTFRLESIPHSLFLESVHSMFISQTSFSRREAPIGRGRLSEKWRSLRKQNSASREGSISNDVLHGKRPLNRIITVPKITCKLRNANAVLLIFFWLD